MGLVDKKKQAQANEKFFGRATEVAAFANNFLQPHKRLLPLVNIFGQGGVGKTTLLKKVADQVNSDSYKAYCVLAQTDARHLSPSTVMQEWADQLEKSFKGAFDDFGKALNRYEPDSAKKVFEQRTDLVGVAKGVTKGVATVTGFGGVYDAVEKGYDFANKELERRRKQDLRSLTVAFIKDLNALAERHTTFNGERRYYRLVLALDGFEQTENQLTPWLLEHLLHEETAPDLSTNVVLVIAGRYQLMGRELAATTEKWDDFKEYIYSFPLDGLDLEQTSQYLASYNVSDPTKVKQIFELTKGLPLWLNALSRYGFDIGEPKATDDVAKVFLQQIGQQEPEAELKRRLVREVGLYRGQFGLDDIAALGYEAGKLPGLYEWLKLQAFVLDYPRYIYHDTARELFSKALYEYSQDEYNRVACAQFACYQKRLELLQADQGKAVYKSLEWQKLALNAIYSGLLTCATPTGQLPDYTSVIRLAIALWVETEVDNDLKTLLDYLLAEVRCARLTQTARNTAEDLRTALFSELPQPRLQVLDRLTQPLADASSLARLHYLQSLVYAIAGDFTSALTQLDEVFELESDNAEFRRARGVTLHELKRYEEALADHNRAIELEPDNALHYRERGTTRHELKQYEAALADYNRAIELQPDNPGNYRERGVTLHELKRYEAALADHNRAIELEPNIALYHRSRAIILHELKEVKAAVVSQRRAVELEPNDAQYCKELGFLLAMSGDNQQAAKCYSRAAKLDSDNPHYQIQAGWLYHKMGDIAAARQCYERAAVQNYPLAAVLLAALSQD